jgi:hypothetical protein
MSGKKVYSVTMSYKEHYFIEAYDADGVEEQIRTGQVEPWEEDIPIMEITELNREELH